MEGDLMCHVFYYACHLNPVGHTFRVCADHDARQETRKDRGEGGRRRRRRRRERERENHGISYYSDFACGGREIVVSIAAMQSTGRSRFRISGGARNFFLNQNFQTPLASTQPPTSWVTAW